MGVGLMCFLCEKSYLNTPVPRPLSMCHSCIEEVVDHIPTESMKARRMALCPRIIRIEIALVELKIFHPWLVASMGQPLLRLPSVCV